MADFHPPCRHRCLYIVDCALEAAASCGWDPNTEMELHGTAEHPCQRRTPMHASVYHSPERPTICRPRARFSNHPKLARGHLTTDQCPCRRCQKWEARFDSKEGASSLRPLPGESSLMDLVPEIPEYIVSCYPGLLVIASTPRMQSSVQTPANTFIYLSVLLEIAYQPTTVFGCAQLKLDTERCGNKIKKDSLELLKKSFEHLFDILNNRRHIFHDQDGVFDTVLTQMIANCLCRSRHQKNAEYARAQWLKELYNDGKRYQLLDKLQARLSGRLKESVSSTPSRSPSTDFELCSVERNVAHRVTKKVLQPLTETDQQSGFIYLISHPREKDMFKVGHTKDNQQRFKKHQRCYEDCKLVSEDLTSYVHRVEQLILMEFWHQHYKLKEKCPRCHVNHKEWLKVDEETLLTSFKKWVGFANGHIRPYDKNGIFKSRKVAMPLPARDPARDDKSPTSTPTKRPRRSDVASQKSPKFYVESDDGSDISINERMSKLNFDS